MSPCMRYSVLSKTLRRSRQPGRRSSIKRSNNVLESSSRRRALAFYGTYDRPSSDDA